MSALVLGLLAVLALYVGMHVFVHSDEYHGTVYVAVVVLGWLIYMLGLRAAAFHAWRVGTSRP